MIADRLQQALRRWIELGRGEPGLLEGWEYLRVYCWLATHAGKPYKADPDIAAYLKASHAHFGRTGYDALLQQSSRCARCGTPYRVENLQVCTECDREYCYRCSQTTLPLNEHGDRQCPCGGVLVG